MQAQLNGVARNRPIYESIAREHAETGVLPAHAPSVKKILSYPGLLSSPSCDLPSSPVRAVFPTKPNVVQPHTHS